MSSKIFLIILFLLAVITRFSGINWGNGIFFHPDENNMATALSQLSWNNFNPNFYAYGQFPLYLGFFSLKIIGLTNNFPNSVFILRFWSAIFSLSSLYFFYKIFSNKFFLILLIFSPGLIQLSHFGTTESLLVMVFAICLYLSIYKPKSYFVYSLILAIGVASKISALIFFVPFIIINFKKPLLIVFSLIITLILSTLLSPYNLINFADFKSSMVYETSVAAGKLPVFYTHQFLGSIPYFFQFTRIFPYTSGITVYIFAFISIFLINKSLLKNKRFLIIGISSLVYFLYFGQLYVKWTRFMSPLFFIFPLLSSQLINRQKKIFSNSAYSTWNYPWNDLF